jgi:hypothetical protein
VGESAAGPDSKEEPFAVLKAVTLRRKNLVAGFAEVAVMAFSNRSGQSIKNVAAVAFPQYNPPSQED